jgi:hypothetical protein
MSEEPEGCSYREHERAPLCNKVCDPGERWCPYHLLLQNPAIIPKTPAKEDGPQHFRTPRGYDE